MKNPRGDNNLGTIACIADKTNYSRGIGDLSILLDGFSTWPHVAIHIVNCLDVSVIIPIYRNGNGISVYPDYKEWQQGQIGFIYALKNLSARWFNKTYCTKTIKAATLERLELEIKEYNQYLINKEKQ